jgi:NTE family protein
METKDVALVLSSGGPRGFAYIGAIEELESRGYNITSVAGSSIGSLVGGIYAAGKLPEFKEWLFSLNNLKMMRLLDFSIKKSYLLKGTKVMEAIESVVPDVEIESLLIPFVAVATDLYTGEPQVFWKGKLFEAIRASISIPSLFMPVKYGSQTLVDGGITSTLPLSYVARNGHDILVGFDVNDVEPDTVPKDGADDNYFSILSRSFGIANHTIAKLEAQLCKPDILVKMSMDSYGAIPDYAKGSEISEKGRTLMAAALDEYEKNLKK